MRAQLREAAQRRDRRDDRHQDQWCDGREKDVDVDLTDRVDRLDVGLRDEADRDPTAKAISATMLKFRPLLRSHQMPAQATNTAARVASDAQFQLILRNPCSWRVHSLGSPLAAWPST